MSMFDRILRCAEGGVVFGEHFFGREAQIERLRNCALYKPVVISTSVVGLGRMGKSSLVWNALMHDEALALEHKRLIVWLEIAYFQQPHELFYQIGQELFTKVQCLDAFSDSIARFEKALDDLLRQTALWQLVRCMQSLLNLCKAKGWKVIAILDEFDHARQLFLGNPAGFQSLRSMISTPKAKLNLVLVSRRSLYRIEKVADPSISCFHGLVERINVQPFTMDERAKVEPFLQELFEDHALLQEFSRVSGGCPWLFFGVIAKMLMSRSAPRYITAADGDALLRKFHEESQDYFLWIKSWLSEEGWLSSLVNRVLGPLSTDDPVAVGEFYRYGLLREASDDPSETVNEAFREWLYEYRQVLNLRDFLGDIEKRLRHYLWDRLQKYSSEWTEKTSHGEEFPDFSRRVKEMLKNRRKQEERRQSDNLFDHGVFKDYIEIIQHYWDSLFSHGLGQTFGWWELRLECLREVRNHLSHANPEMVYQEERQAAERYCLEIDEILSSLGYEPVSARW